VEEKMSSEKGGSKADTLVKAVLVFCISLLSFSVGTYVGKQVSDSDHRRLALEGEFKADRSVASTDENADEKISEQEVESLTEEFINKEKNEREPAAANEHGEAHGKPVTKEEHGHAAAAPKAAEGHAEEAPAADGYKAYNRGAKKEEAPAKHEDKKEAHEAPAKAAPKSAAHEPEHGEEHAPAAAAPKHEAPAKKEAAHEPAHSPSAAAEKVSHDEAPSDGMKEERKPSSALPSVASSAIGKYTVQVASYADEKEAQGHAAGLKGKGWNAFYLSANVNGRTWYRVLVGLFNNSKSANDFRAQFMKEANTKSAIVQKIVQ
jgi:cell division septation protein DedD